MSLLLYLSPSFRLCLPGVQPRSTHCNRLICLETRWQELASHKAFVLYFALIFSFQVHLQCVIKPNGTYCWVRASLEKIIYFGISNLTLMELVIWDITELSRRMVSARNNLETRLGGFCFVCLPPSASLSEKKPQRLFRPRGQYSHHCKDT